MFGRLHYAIVKELLSFWRDPKSRATILVLPVIQVLLFAFAATLEVKNVDIALLDQDQGRYSHEFVARVASASFVGDIVEVRSLDEMGNMIAERDIVLGIHISPDFSRALISGGGADVQVLLDGRRANASQIVFSYLSAIASEMGLDVSRNNVSAGMAPRAQVRHWFNPNLDFIWFIVPSLAATMGMITPLMMTSLSIARERELGTYDQMLVSPLSPSEIIAAKIIPAFMSGLFVATVITLLAVYGFNVPFAGNPVWFFLSLMVFLMAVIGYGLSISALCHTQQQAILGMFMSIIPIMLTSGFVSPVDNMPHWLQIAAQINPLKHFLVVLQGTFLKSMSGAQIWHNTWPLIIIGAVTLTAAITIIRQRMD